MTKRASRFDACVAAGKSLLHRHELVEVAVELFAFVRITSRRTDGVASDTSEKCRYRDSRRGKNPGYEISPTKSDGRRVIQNQGSRLKAVEVHASVGIAMMDTQ